MGGTAPASPDRAGRAHALLGWPMPSCEAHGAAALWEATPLERERDALSTRSRWKCEGGGGERTARKGFRTVRYASCCCRAFDRSMEPRVQAVRPSTVNELRL